MHSYLRQLESANGAARLAYTEDGDALADPLWGGAHYRPPQYTPRVLRQVAAPAPKEKPRNIADHRVPSKDKRRAIIVEQIASCERALGRARAALVAYDAEREVVA